MSYKDIEKRRLKEKQKVKASCCICGGDAFVRRDTLCRYKNVTCGEKCKSILLKRARSTLLNENDFIKSYLLFECGYQALCKIYRIGGKRGLNILQLNRIEVKTAHEIQKIMKEKGLGKWVKAEMHVCKRCSKVFKYRKGSTCGLFCSHDCYIKYCGRTSIEEKIAILLTEIKLDYKEQYKIKRSYFDFFLPSKNILIECDGQYWHSLPEAIIRDKYKDKLAQENGFRLLRFSEFNINNNLHLIGDKLCSL